MVTGQKNAYSAITNPWTGQSAPDGCQKVENQKHTISQKGDSPYLASRVICASWKVFNNKSWRSFGYVHKLAFCTAV